MGGIPRPHVTPEALQEGLPEVLDPEPVGQAGGSKRTFRANWRDQVVAVQVLEEFQAERLKREITALKSIHSPHVPQLLYVTQMSFADQTLPVLICQFVEGPTLEEQVSKGQLYGPSALKKLAQDISLGLLAIHASELVHRDLKPPNIIITGNENSAVVVDLGIAKHLDSTTITQVQPGTPGWLTPEQILNDRVDKRTDLFLLGLVLHFAAAGTHPFTPGDPNQNIVESPPNITVEESHDTQWKELIEWLLQKRPYDRPRQIKIVLSLLEGLA